MSTTLSDTFGRCILLSVYILEAFKKRTPGSGLDLGFKKNLLFKNMRSPIVVFELF
jgi:hypothetical protein